MSADKSGSSFFDSKTLIAIALVGFSWFGWNQYMREKYPDAYKPKVETVAEDGMQEAKKEVVAGEIAGQTGTAEGTARNADQPAQVAPAASQLNVPETLTSYNSEKWNFSISSKGMGIKNIILNDYTDRSKQPMTMGMNKGFLPFETNLIGRTIPLNFVVKKVEENLFVGKAVTDGLEVTKKLLVNPENFSIDTKISVSGNLKNFAGIKTYLSENLKEQGEKIMFLPQRGGQELYVSHSGDEDRLLARTVEEEGGTFSNVNLASLSTHYFSVGILDKSKVMPQISSVVNKKEKSFLGILKHEIINQTKNFEVHYVGFAGPKSLETLKSIDEKVTAIIDFGWFNSIATYILKLLRVFHGLVGNWGFAIILLTLVVRALLLPLNIVSFRSMKAMQSIQPQVKLIREKYKEEPTRMNQEMTALWKTNKVNPIAGCLPMFIQFPVFIALYRVLGQSIELYQSPFALWITDLSEKDPYYILPVLMGAAMFVQMRIQPNTMESAQRKIMMFMPIMFTFFMVSLPSGLTLYMLISTLFGLLQHFYFMRERQAVQTA